MTSSDHTGSTALVTAASRGFGPGIGYLARFGPGVTPDDVGKATVDLVTSANDAPGAYLLTPAGLAPLE